MGILKRISDALTDPHPERDETHAATRYAMMQPELVPDLPEPQETWEEKARVFIRENPDVMAEFVRMAIYWKRRGVKRGMKAIAEDYRYSRATAPAGKKYKWNNNMTSFVSRHLMETVPELRGYFDVRHQSPKTKKVLA